MESIYFLLTFIGFIALVITILHLHTNGFFVRNKKKKS